MSRRRLRPFPALNRLLAPLALLAPLVAGVTLAEAPSSAATDARSGSPTADAPPATPPAKLEKKLKRKLAKPLLRTDAPDDAIEHYVRKRAPGGHGPLSYERYRRALDRMGRMPRYSSRLKRFLATDEAATPAAAWSALGPGNIGGRTRALVIDPTTPDTMYAGGVAGGVWKTVDGGSSWMPIGDALANLAVASIALDPRDPDVIYVGTGEGYFNGDSVRGAGIFKSMDGGSTWNHLSSTATEDFYYVNDVVVSPNASARVYAATRSGVWRSDNGGQSWTAVLPVTVEGGCGDLVLRTDTSTDYALVACGNGEPGTVYLNTDAGGAGTWTSVLAEPTMSRTTLAIAPSDPSVVYALTTENDSSSRYYYGLHAVFRSNDGGRTWEARVRNTSQVKLNTTLLSNTVYAFYAECYPGRRVYWINQGWYDNIIGVDPADPDIVWAGGVDMYRSDDGGANWGLASHWWADPATQTSYAHADQHVIAFHPDYNGTTNRRMFLGNDGGVSMTDDARAATQTGNRAACNPEAGVLPWQRLNNHYGVTQFYHGVPYPDGRSWFGGTQDNGTIRGTESTGTEGWETLIGGDGGYVGVDPVNTDVLYGENYGLSLQKSTDGGETWVSATSGISDQGFLFTAPFLVDPVSAARLWTGGSYVWRSIDRATSWQRASRRLRVGSAVSAVAVSPVDANLVLVGSTSGHIFRSTAALTANSNTDWPSVRPREDYVSWVAWDPVDRQVAYATYSTFGGAHVWKTTDGGKTWTSIDGTGAATLPDIPVHVVVVDPAVRTTLYVGTDLGVFVSHDSGSSWAVEVTGFPDVVTESMTFQGGTLYAFTHGRGAWRVSLR